MSQHDQTRRRPVRAALAVMSLTVVVLGAQALAAGPATAAESSAWVRAAHLVPGLGTMSIGLSPLDGSTGSSTPSAGVTPAPAAQGMLAIAPAASYGQVSDYRQIPVGYYTISVRPSGASPTSAPLITGTLKAEAGQAFTVAGLGTKVAPTVAALTDDLTPPPAGRSRVRLLPAAQTAPTVTVTARNGPTVAEDAAFGRPTGYATVPAGTWPLEAEATAGTVRSDVTLAAGDVYTLLVLDGDRGLRITPVVDAAGMGVTPEGGAAAGGGGLAAAATGPGHAGRALPVSLLLVTAAGLTLVAARRRTGTTPARAPAGHDGRPS